MGDFEGARTGTLVRRSKHWFKVHVREKRGQVGIVTGLEYYQDNDRLVTWPIVMWEGAVMPSLVHPDNCEVAPSRWKKNLRD